MAGRDDAVAREPRAQRRNQHRADAIGPVRHLVGFGVDQQGITDPVPCERDLFLMRHCTLGPEVARVAGLGERGIERWNVGISELGVEHPLHRRLQPARHGDVVGVNAPMTMRQLALEIEHVPRTNVTKDDAPEARIGGVGFSIFRAQTNEWILARKDEAMRISDGHGVIFSLCRWRKYPGFAPAAKEKTAMASSRGG